MGIWEKCLIGLCICFGAEAFVLPFGGDAARRGGGTRPPLRRRGGRTRGRAGNDHHPSPVSEACSNTLRAGIVLFHASSSGQMPGMDEASPSSSNGRSSRSIGDVVQGLHGSKYQFNQAGLNYEGQQFAETGYGNNSIPKKQNYDAEPLPDWAIRRQDKCRELNDNIPSNAQILKLNEQGKVTFTITNEERSWEKYHIFWMGNNNDNDFKVVAQIQPMAGMLAPRGTSSSDGYSDTETISVAVLDPNAIQEGWILAATEADTWKFRIDL